MKIRLTVFYGGWRNRGGDMWKPITPSGYNERRKGLVPVAGGQLFVNRRADGRFTEWGETKKSLPLLRYEIVYYLDSPVYRYFQWDIPEFEVWE